MYNKVLSCDCNLVHEDAVKKATNNMLSDEKIKDVSYLFKVLGDKTRMKIMLCLEQTEMCVCDLAVTLNMTKSAISHQLHSLRKAKMVKSRREGKNVFYSLDDDHVTGIIQLAVTHSSH